MQQIRRNTVLILAFAILVVCFTAVISLTSTTTAQADGIEDVDSYTFTLVTNNSGEQGYSVAIKAAKKPSIETAIIPETYNGLPVTEIANNGFMACAKLQKVILPITIKKIGNNAFMNCAKLERISLASVESIGMNAFALCPLLDRTYIPNTVKSVGANVFRNNANTIFVQSSEEEVASEWQSTWNSYCTGDIVYGIEPENTVGYLEILNDAGSVIGYEVAAYQMITAQDADIVIYNSFRPDDESEYLPVLNICSEAFTFSQVNSITVKDRRSEYDNAPIFTHKINIRSNAFVGFGGQEVHFEIGVSFNHPEGLQQYNVAESWLDSSEIVGDGNNKSVRIFEAATINTVTLPSNIDFIPERMFFDCAYLATIKFTGSMEENTLASSITRIGTGAFSSCVNLPS